MVNHIPCFVSINLSRSGGYRSTTINSRGALAQLSSSITKDIVSSLFCIAILIVLSASLGIKDILVSIETTRVVSLLVPVGIKSCSLSAGFECITGVDAIGSEGGIGNLDRSGCI